MCAIQCSSRKKTRNENKTLVRCKLKRCTYRTMQNMMQGGFSNNFCLLLFLLIINIKTAGTTWPFLFAIDKAYKRTNFVNLRKIIENKGINEVIDIHD